MLDNMKKKIIIFLIIQFLSIVYTNSYEGYTIKTDEGYIMEVKLNYEKILPPDKIIIISIEIKNVSGPYILLCRASVDEKFEKTTECIKIVENLRFESKIEENRQILKGRISIDITEYQNKNINIPIIILGIYGECKGGCENFLVGPFVCPIQVEMNTKEKYYQNILLLFFLCLFFILFLLLLKNKKKKYN